MVSPSRSKPNSPPSPPFAISRYCHLASSYILSYERRVFKKVYWLTISSTDLIISPFPISTHHAKPACKCRSNKSTLDLFASDHQGRVYTEQQHPLARWNVSRRGISPRFPIPFLSFSIVYVTIIPDSQAFVKYYFRSFRKKIPRVPNFSRLDIAYPGNHSHAYATTAPNFSQLDLQCFRLTTMHL